MVLMLKYTVFYNGFVQLKVAIKWNPLDQIFDFKEEMTDLSFFFIFKSKQILKKMKIRKIHFNSFAQRRLVGVNILCCWYECLFGHISYKSIEIIPDTIGKSNCEIFSYLFTMLFPISSDFQLKYHRYEQDILSYWMIYADS